jgi:hypothetical protein
VRVRPTAHFNSIHLLACLACHQVIHHPERFQFSSQTTGTSPSASCLVGSLPARTRPSESRLTTSTPPAAKQSPYPTNNRDHGRFCSPPSSTRPQAQSGRLLPGPSARVLVPHLPMHTNKRTMQMLLPLRRILGSLTFPSAASLFYSSTLVSLAAACLQWADTHISVTSSSTMSVAVSARTSHTVPLQYLLT